MENQSERLRVMESPYFIQLASHYRCIPLFERGFRSSGIFLDWSLILVIRQDILRRKSKKIYEIQQATLLHKTPFHKGGLRGIICTKRKSLRQKSQKSNNMHEANHTSAK